VVRAYRYAWAQRCEGETVESREDKELTWNTDEAKWLFIRALRREEEQAYVSGVLPTQPPGTTPIPQTAEA
jgi:hypothetical protein